MLQYLLNTTAIWLISLVLFDVFLRRESYHAYNRFYLVFTFLLGIILPLCEWQDNSGLYQASLSQPAERVITIKQNIAAASVPSLTTGWERWLAIIYAIGLLTTLVVLILDVVKLMIFYRSGKRSKRGMWQVIETGKGHAPFSFLNILFVNSRQQYSADEWDMISVHEQRHRSLYHFADLLLMQAGHVVFWFHPLVYVYSKRLLLVHEYQADSASAQFPNVYGKFLVEQVLLQSAPILSHSFNRSPIKKRIVMLTRRSSVASKIRMLVFVPVALVSVFCFTRSSFSQPFTRKGNIITYKGNKFELSKPHTDTVIITDPVTGQEFTKYITIDPAPIKMNGNSIPREVDKYPYFKGKDKNLRAYLLKNLKDELSKLDDGEYRLGMGNVLIGENGAVIYFDAPDIRRCFSNKEIEKNQVLDTLPSNQKTALGAGDRQMMIIPQDDRVSKRIRENVFKKTCELMYNAPAYIPAELNGRKVATWITDNYTFWTPFKVKDHKLYDKDKDNEYVPL